MEGLPEIAEYAALIALIIVIQLVVTYALPKLMRRWGKEQREAFKKGLEPGMKMNRVVWRYFLWPLIFLLGAWVAYLFFTGQL